MSPTPLKPWAEVEEDVPTSGLETHGQFKTAPARTFGSLKAQPLALNSSNQWIAFLTRYSISSHWALAPLALAFGCLLYQSMSDAGTNRFLTTVEILSIFAGGLIIAVSKLARRARLVDLQSAMQCGSATSALGSLGDLPDFGPIWKSVEGHFANVEAKTFELGESYRKLSLEMTLADAQRKQIENVMQAISDPIIVTDAFDQLMQANAAAGELLGFKSEEIIRKPIRDIIQSEKLVKLIGEAREADQRSAERRSELEIGDRAFAVEMSPLVTQQNGDASSSGDHGVVTTLRDITREREASQNKSQFVAHVAHELRTPLSSIRAYVEMLVDGEAQDEKTLKEYYDIIQTSADRLGRLIDNMLNISRIEAGTVRINKEPVSISMVLKEVIDVVRPQAEAKKITLKDTLALAIHRIMADRDLIYQAVMNLLSNAIKYTPEGGEVTVRMTPREDQHLMVIDVIDTGAGIPEQDLPHMFEKFFRVEANKKMAKGTGLGLNLVKNIVEKVHDGKISLVSKVGQGSTFSISLPLLK